MATKQIAPVAPSESVTKELSSKILGIKATANQLFNAKTKTFVVKSQGDADAAGAVCQEIGGYLKLVGSYWDDVVASAHALHKDLVAKRKEFLDPAQSLDRAIKAAVQTWVTAEQKKAEALQEKLAVKAEAAGLPPPIVEGPAVEGLSAKRKWIHKTLDTTAMKEFVKAVAAGKAPIEALEINESWLGKDIDLHHERAAKDPLTGKTYLYPGVEIYEITNMVRKSS